METPLALSSEPAQKNERVNVEAIRLRLRALHWPFNNLETIALLSHVTLPHTPASLDALRAATAVAVAHAANADIAKFLAEVFVAVVQTVAPLQIVECYESSCIDAGIWTQVEVPLLPESERAPLSDAERAARHEASKKAQAEIDARYAADVADYVDAHGHRPVPCGCAHSHESGDYEDE